MQKENILGGDNVCVKFTPMTTNTRHSLGTF